MYLLPHDPPSRPCVFESVSGPEVGDVVRYHELSPGEVDAQDASAGAVGAVRQEVKG